jgi:hypothetical protein
LKNVINDKLVILVVAHKKCVIKEKPYYIPLQVGKEGKQSLGFIGDNTGDNISFKNSYYCELTAIYWAWRNINSQYIGLNHYRRFFFNGLNYFFLYNILLRKVDYSRFILTGKHALKLLHKYDIILPTKRNIGENSVWEQYKKYHNINDLQKAKKIIKLLYPEYMNSFEKVMSGRKIFQFNMFITKREILNRYAQWLFRILFKLEEESDLVNYSSYQQRLFGFIGERLFNIWIDHNRLKVKYLRVLNTESPFHITRK